jgi:glyceraldehyde 3-phosphate dehydrogenase
MAIRVAINGYGRIGRMVLRALYESGRKDIEIIAINSSGGDAESNAHLTRYDSAHGRFPFEVGVDGDDMIINSHKIKTFATRNPAELPWKELAIDIVMECTGAFNSKAKSQAHIDAGAKKVLLSAPGGSDVDATVVYGVNHKVIKASHTVISNASCTTNGLAPMVQPLHEKIGIVNGLMNTIHSYTNDQVLTDAHHTDMRRARSATTSLIPTKTGAAAAVGLVLPELNGKLDGFAIRVPTINVSLVDLTFTASRPTTKEEVNHIMHEAASKGPLKGILSYNEAPLVSVDYNHTDFSSNFDATLTKVTKDGLLVKVCAWYDNEWGFSCRMLDNAVAMMAAK